MAGPPSFLDLADRYKALSAASDPLERLGAVNGLVLSSTLRFSAARWSQRCVEGRAEKGAGRPLIRR